MSIDTNYIQLIDGVVEFNAILTDFLPAGSVFLIQDVEVASDNRGFIRFSLPFCPFIALCSLMLCC